MNIEKLNEILHIQYPDMEAVAIQQKDIVYEERVKLKCYHCKNYRVKWTCPGHLPQLDYCKIISEYEHASVIVCKTPVEDGITDEIRNISTNRLHRAMLYLEAEMYRQNNSLAMSFIGGSCKLCKNGCRPDACANPELSRAPWEATGCNVVKSLANIGIEVVFPPKDYLYRYGLFLW